MFVAAAGVGAVVEVAEEDNHDIIGGTVEEEVLEAVPKAAVVDQFSVLGTLFNTESVAIYTLGQQVVVELVFALRGEFHPLFGQDLVVNEVGVGPAQHVLHVRIDAFVAKNAI